MRRSHGFWLLCGLSASCAVRGFAIDDHLPGDAGGSAGTATDTAGKSGSAGSQAAGGDGASGAAPQGGKGGGAGSQNQAGVPTADAGEPSVGEGGDGAGGAPSGATAPCDTTDGKPPLLCDDFESGSLNVTKWVPPAGVGVSTDKGPNGPTTNLVHLPGEALATTLTDLPITAAGGVVTVSFWFKTMTQQPSAPVMSFRDRSAEASTLRLGHVQKELGWRNSSNNVFVPQSPTGAILALETWTCVSIHLTYTSIEVRYRGVGSNVVNTLIADDVATANVDMAWQGLPSDERHPVGYPAFGGIVGGGVASDIYLDDVRIAADTSSVCPF